MTNQERKEEKRLNAEFKAKYGARKKNKFVFGQKTKQKRQSWWKSLSDQEKGEYLNKVMARKAQKRLEQMQRETLDLDYNCNDCHHHKTNSCRYDLAHGCKDFVNFS